MENIQVNEEKNPSGVESESPANRAGMASASTHTATPWQVGTGHLTARNHAICAGPRIVATVNGRGYKGGSSNGWAPQSEADAAFIVKAVNSHDALVVAAEAALTTFRHLRDNHAEAWDSTINAETCNAWDSLKAALKLAEVS